ncbi:MAG: peptidase domain-containing ABC transporter [Geminicoccaceae bacterium]
MTGALPPKTRAATAAAEDDLIATLSARRWLNVPAEDGEDCLSGFLPALLSGLDWRGSPEHVAMALPHKPNGLDMVDLLNTMANLGYPASTPFRQALRTLDRRLLPALLFPDGRIGAMKRPLLLVDGPDGEGMICHRLDDGKLVVVEPRRRLFGTIYSFRVARTEITGQAAAQRVAGGSWFRGMIERFRPVLTQIFLVGLALNALSLAMPIFVMLIYDMIVGGMSTNGLDDLLIGVIVAIGFEGFFRFMRLRSIAWLGTRVDHLVSLSIIGRLLHLPSAFTERSTPSVELSRTKALEAVRDFLTGPLLLVVLELPFVVFLLVVIAFLAGPVAIVPLVTAALHISLLLYMRPKLRHAIWRTTKAGSEKEKLLVETLSKIEGLRFNGVANAWFDRLRDVSGAASYGSFRSAFLASVIETFAHGLSVVAGVATMAIGVMLIWRGDITMGALVASLILSWRVLSPLQTICLMLPKIEQLRSSIGQVNRLMEIEPEPHAGTLATAGRQFSGAIGFKNVGLRYSKDQDPIFAGLTVDIAPGELVAIIGSNGAGKSTVLRLVNRLSVPQAGSIRIDGADIRQIDPMELRQHVAYMPERPFIFQGTIADNLRMVNPLASDDALKQALIRVDGWAEISVLPDQLETFIGTGIEKHHVLSSSFGYRINLARAYLHDCAIMLFDEIPFAILNSSTGEIYKSFLKENKGKRTMMIVTYRDDYIQLADKVISLSRDMRPLVSAPTAISKTAAAA